MLLGVSLDLADMRDKNAYESEQRQAGWIDCNDPASRKATCDITVVTLPRPAVARGVSASRQADRVYRSKSQRPCSGGDVSHWQVQIRWHRRKRTSRSSRGEYE